MWVKKIIMKIISEITQSKKNFHLEKILKNAVSFDKSGKLGCATRFRLWSETREIEAKTISLGNEQKGILACDSLNFTAGFEKKEAFNTKTSQRDRYSPDWGLTWTCADPDEHLLLPSLLFQSVPNNKALQIIFRDKTLSRDFKHTITYFFSDQS